MAAGDGDFVVGVEDRELDVLVDDGVGDLEPMPAADFFVALADVVVLPAMVDPDVFETVLMGPEDEYLEGELEVVTAVVRLLVTDGVADFVAEDWQLGVEGFPGVEEGMVVLTTDTNAAVDAFIVGETDTTPTVVVTMLAADEVLDVVTAAKAAIAPEPLTVVVVPEVLDVAVAPDVVDLTTGATTAVTTVAVALEVPDPNPPTELTEFDVVLPTAATTDVDAFITDESDTVDESTAVMAEHVSDEAGDALVGVWEEAATEEEDIVSIPEVFEAVVTGPVIPYGLGAKQHIICALDEEDLAPISVASSCLSIDTRTVDVIPAEDVEEVEVIGTLADSPSWAAEVSLQPGSAGGTSSTLSTGCLTGWIISATSVCAFGVHMSSPKQPIFAVTSWTASPAVPSNIPSLPLLLGSVSAGSKEVISGVEMIWPRKDSERFGCPPSDRR